MWKGPWGLCQGYGQATGDFVAKVTPISQRNEGERDYWACLEMLIPGPDVLISLLSPAGLGHSGFACPSVTELGSDGDCRPRERPSHHVP